MKSAAKTSASIWWPKRQKANTGPSSANAGRLWVSTTNNFSPEAEQEFRNQTISCLKLSLFDLEAAKKRGAQSGRPRKMSPADVEEARTLAAKGVPLKSIQKMFDVSKMSNKLFDIIYGII
jgi:hypothetical protein